MAWPTYQPCTLLAMLYSTRELLPIIFHPIPDLLLTTHQGGTVEALTLRDNFEPWVIRDYGF